LTISGLGDAIVELKANVEGVGSLFDLDGVKEERQLVRTFSYSGIPWEFADTASAAERREANGVETAPNDLISTSRVISATTQGTEYKVQTPYLIIYEVVDSSYSLTDSDIDALSADWTPDVRASFVNDIVNADNEIADNGGYLKPIAVLASDDPYLEHLFSSAGDYVVQVGYVESTIFQQTTTVKRSVWYWHTSTTTIDTTTNNSDHQWVGVAPGSSYNLNISVHEHAIDLANQAIANKYIRITTGPQAGLVGLISSFVAYEDGLKVNRFTIQPQDEASPEGLSWSDVSSESHYEVFTSVSSALGNDYDSWKSQLGDTYRVALTQPSLLGVEVSDLETAAYDSARAFTDGGASRRVQTDSSIDLDTGIVTVAAVDDDLVDGGDLQVFAPAEQRVNSIRGPISIEGGAVAASY